MVEADLARATFPRFSLAEVGQRSATELRLMSPLTGTTVELCRSEKGVPFAQLLGTQSGVCHARWPLYPVLGGDNGPGYVEVNRWGVQVKGRQGLLQLQFSRLEDHSLRSYLMQAYDVLLGNERPTLTVRFPRPRDPRAAFSFESSKSWRAA